MIFAFAVSVSYFSVVEAGVQDTPQYDIYLVIDVSGSMQEESKLVFAKQAALEFVDAFQLDQSSDHRIGLVAFSDYAKMLVELDDNSKNLKEGINKLYPEGATAMGDGISIATQSLSENTRPDAQKIIVLLSDGMSNTGLHPLSAAGTARENDITIFSVGYGYNADAWTLKAVASVTHGKYYNALTGQDLADAFNEIADVLISPLSHYSSRILILIAIPVLLFIPTIERGLTTMMRRAEDKPVERIVKPKRTEDKPKTKIDKLKITCPNCNHLNRSTSKVCAKCGNSVYHIYSRIKTPVKGKDKLKITCPNCNYVNRTTSKFCVKCGSPVKGRVK